MKTWKFQKFFLPKFIINLNKINRLILLSTKKTTKNSHKITWKRWYLKISYKKRIVIWEIMNDVWALPSLSIFLQ